MYVNKENKIRSVISYILALALSVVFALFLSGRTGWFLFTMLVLMPPISLVMAFIARKYITVTAEISDTELYKGQKTKIILTVKNDSFLPTPAVNISFRSTEALECVSDTASCCVYVMPRSQSTAEMEYTAKMWCRSYAGAEKITLSDYAGIFRIRLLSDVTDKIFSVKIIPDIKELENASGLMKSVSDACARSDEDDDSSDMSIQGFNGVPGYEHREYVPGDPVRRINWKMSAKKDSYYVRLDDAVSASRHNVILDPVNAGKSFADGELCGETMLGFLQMLARTNFGANVFFYLDGWQCIETEDEGDIGKLRILLAGYEYNMTAERMPSEELYSQLHKQSKSFICFTPLYDEVLSAVASPSVSDARTDITMTVAAVSIGSSDKISTSGIWQIEPDGTCVCL